MFHLLIWEYTRFDEFRQGKGLDGRFFPVQNKQASLFFLAEIGYTITSDWEEFDVFGPVRSEAPF